MPLQPSQKRRASRRVRTLDTIGWTVVTVSVAFVAYQALGRRLGLHAVPAAPLGLG